MPKNMLTDTEIQTLSIRRYFITMKPARVLVKIACAKPAKQSQGGMCNGLFGIVYLQPGPSSTKQSLYVIQGHTSYKPHYMYFILPNRLGRIQYPVGLEAS